jgi:2-aminoethylphosphonate-pyruvate transaminase
LIDERILDEHHIDLLVHGDDNSNLISEERLQVFPRTAGVSSSDLRQRVQQSIASINNQKLMLTPGPAVVLHENLEYLKPLFGRGDDEYTAMSDSVINWIKELSGQDEVIMAQGSSTFALELAMHSFVDGNILLISTGYYSDRLERLLPDGCKVTICHYQDIGKIDEKFDWVLCAYTETSVAFKVDLIAVKSMSDKCEAKLYLDATGSIGLECNHGLADVMAFSSCKGLFGLTGGCFVAYKHDLTPKPNELFYFNLETQAKKMITGPYHAIASLYGVMRKHAKLRDRVINSKKAVIDKWPHLARRDNQPLLCTYLEGQILPKDENIILYTPRSKLSGSVICHFGEIHCDQLNIIKRISVKSTEKV